MLIPYSLVWRADSSWKITKQMSIDFLCVRGFFRTRRRTPSCHTVSFLSRMGGTLNLPIKYRNEHRLIIFWRVTGMLLWSNIGWIVWIRRSLLQWRRNLWINWTCVDKYQKDKCGITLHSLRVKWLKWHQIDPYFSNEVFYCSSGWISDALKWNGLISLNLQGKSNEMIPEQEAEAMGPWLVKFHTLLEDEDIPPECVYNAEQTILYYQNLLNTLYVYM